PHSGILANSTTPNLNVEKALEPIHFPPALGTALSSVVMESQQMHDRVMQQMVRPAGRTTSVAALAMVCCLAWCAPTHGQPSQDPPAVRCVAFSPDGRLLAACGSNSTRDGVLAVWETEGWGLKHVQNEQAGYPCLEFSPDGRRLALARFAPETHLIDVASGEQIGELDGHAQYSRCVAFTPDGSRIVTGGYDGKVKIWDANTKELSETISGGMGKLYAVDVSADGRLLAVADAGTSHLRLFDLETLREAFVSPRMSSLLTHASFGPRGRLVSVTSWGGFSQVFDAATHELAFKFDTNSSDWTTFSADGSMVAVAARYTVYVYSFPAADELTETKIKRLIAEFQGDEYERRQAAYDELAALGGVCEPFLAAAMDSDDPEMRWRTRRLRDRLMLADAAEQLQIDGRNGCVAFSPDGRLLVAGDAAGNLTAWNVGDWSVARRWRLPVED
ncbi:MAG: hypothetical protein AAF961_00080, partial [Planctomycetota bacterium]